MDPITPQSNPEEFKNYGSGSAPIGAAWQQTAPSTTGPAVPATTPTVRYNTDGTLNTTNSQPKTPEQVAQERDLTDSEKQLLRNQTYGELQSQLDSIDLAAKSVVARYNEQEKNALGRSRALAAAGGTIGTVNEATDQKQVQDTYSAAIADVLNKANSEKANARISTEDRYQNNLNNARNKKIGDMEAFNAQNEKKQKEVQDNIVNYIKAGGDLAKYNADDLKTIQAQTGWSPIQFELVTNANKPKANQVDYTWAWKGDTLVGYGTDPKTGKIVTQTHSADELGIPKEDRAKALNFITNKDTNEVYYYDEKNPQALTKLGTAGSQTKTTTDTVNVKEGKNTYTYLITRDAMGNEVKREKLGSGGSPVVVQKSVPANKLTTEEKKFQTKLQSEQTRLARSGSWAESYDAVAGMYPEMSTPLTAAEKATVAQKYGQDYANGVETRLDVLLNKPKYYSQAKKEKSTSTTKPGGQIQVPPAKK